jgi:hypothetical protein
VCPIDGTALVEPAMSGGRIAEALLAPAMSENGDVPALVRGLLDRVIIPALVREWIGQNAKPEAN